MPPASAGGLVGRLEAIASLRARRVVGLMSGTSCDGIDAALVRIEGCGSSTRAEVVRFLCRRYPQGLQARAASAAGATAPEIARLNFDIGEAFADAALAVIESAGLAPGDVHLIGSHGQTVFHEPPDGAGTGATFQIGEADVIAERTGIVTVADFRTADVAAGGHGAPLIPLVDWLLFRPDSGARIMLNLGGIANLTWVTLDAADVRAFDTGPGNALIDEIVGAATGGLERMDAGGARGLRGQPMASAVEAFLERPYFSLRPPKSTGKGTFGRAAAEELAGAAFQGRAIAALSEREVDDLLATAVAVTARSVRDAVGAFVPVSPEPTDLVVSGGGARNLALVGTLAGLFAPCPVRGLDSLGMDPDAKEAVGFAVLANETILGMPGNLPAVTGASRPVVLGKISAGM